MTKKELAVGDSTSVELIFATGHYSRQTSKSARVMSNAPGRAPRLSFSAHPVKHPDSLDVFTITPYVLNLDSLRPEDQPKKWQYKLAVKNVSNEPFSLEMVSGPIGEGVEVKIPGGKIKPGKEKTIKVKIDPDLAGELITRSFTIEASDSAGTRYTFPIMKNSRWDTKPTSSR